MSSVLAVFGRSELNLGRVDDSKDGGGGGRDGRTLWGKGSNGKDSIYTEYFCYFVLRD